MTENLGETIDNYKN